MTKKDSSTKHGFTNYKQNASDENKQTNGKQKK